MENYDSNKSLNINTEEALQKEVVRFLRSTDLLFTSVLCDDLNTVEKRVHGSKMGYTSGTPDILILTPCSGYNSLAIELKTPAYGRGKLSFHQQKFLETMRDECNCFTIVSNDLVGIISIIQRYIDECLI